MINTNFDVYSDTPKGGDPDKQSATLRRYHSSLWSKPLPGGLVFDLSIKTPGAYLHHHSALGEFVLASDSIGHTYRYSKLVAPVISELPDDELDDFFRLCSTIGAYTVFPGRTIDKKPTINGARGLHPKVGDRFDLTLECIRLHYTDEMSPLSEVLTRYGSFFDLFESFEGFVDFFLFQDLLTGNNGSVNFFLPHSDFEKSPYPKDVAAYQDYRRAVMDFVLARNARISSQPL